MFCERKPEKYKIKKKKLSLAGKNRVFTEMEI